MCTRNVQHCKLTFSGVFLINYSLVNLSLTKNLCVLEEICQSEEDDIILNLFSSWLGGGVLRAHYMYLT